MLFLVCQSEKNYMKRKLEIGGALVMLIRKLKL